MRKIIAAMRVSLDGFIEGPNGELDWVENWQDSYDLMSQVDTCILGAGMYPGYEQYWTAILADPTAILPFSGKAPTQGEIDYAHFADRTAHLVLSRTMPSAAWKHTRIAREVEEIHRLKRQPGKDMYAVGGAKLVSGLLNMGLIDELRLLVHPIVLGQGKLLFEGVSQRHALQLRQVRPFPGDSVSLTYGLA